MSKKVFINLPVKDLGKSRRFFESLGYSFNPKFSNDNGACMVVSEQIFVMLLTEKFFATFITKKIADAHKATEVLVCLNENSRAAVDAHVEKAVQAGASEAREPQDHGFMYGRSFHDLDGHAWEIVWMDEAAA